MTLLIGTLTLAVNIQSVKTEPKSLSLNDEGSAGLHKTTETLGNANPEYSDLSSLKDWVMQAEESEFANRLTAKEVNGFCASLPQVNVGSMPNEMVQTESSVVDQDPTKLVMGLDETRPNGFPQLVSMIASKGENFARAFLLHRGFLGG